MSELHISPAMECLVRAMETMAFTTPAPADPSLSPSADSLLVSMPFTGPFSGTVEMVASEKVGIGLAANILATTSKDPAATFHARDALKELLNVACGLLLPTLAPQESAAVPFKMTLPQLTGFDVRAQWPAFFAGCDVCVLDVDRELIALRVKRA